MPSMESQLNHGEFKSKSELQIKNGRSEAVQKKEATLEISQGLRNFTAPTKLVALDFSLYSF